MLMLIYSTSDHQRCSWKRLDCLVCLRLWISGNIVNMWIIIRWDRSTKSALSVFLVEHGILLLLSGSQIHWVRLIYVLKVWQLKEHQFKLNEMRQVALAGWVNDRIWFNTYFLTTNRRGQHVSMLVNSHDGFSYSLTSISVHLFQYHSSLFSLFFLCLY